MMYCTRLAIAAAQPKWGSIEGKLINEKEEPLAYAHIQLLEDNKGTSTTAEGYFRITDLPPGDYHLRFSHLGYTPHTQVVSLSASQAIDLGPITLLVDHHTFEEVIVSATRVEQRVENVPLPVTVISGDQIKRMGSMRLGEVLAEQTGLTIIPNMASGIGPQLQGLDPDYTMILINNQPLIGRIAGIMDLNRITVGHIKRVEITKGPSSSLYGSEALAGVIHIITEDPASPLSTRLSTRYRTYNTLDLNAHLGITQQAIDIQADVNRYSSDGYDLTPETLSRTSPPFYSYTLHGLFKYRLNSSSTLQFRARYFTEEQSDLSTITLQETPQNLDIQARQNDLNLSPAFIHSFSPRAKLILTNYTTTYRTRSNYLFQSTGVPYSEGYFNQLYNKSELQVDFSLTERLSFVSGGGYILETLTSDRYDGLNRFHARYLFIQNEWVPYARKLILLTGLRFDSHSEYASQLSPKISLQYKWTSWCKLKGSIGTGFKAPDFRQLFLNYTSPSVGYTVLGSNLVQQQLEELKQQGQLLRQLIDPLTLNDIQAEQSLAYHLGLDFSLYKKHKFQFRFFRNNISHLIETAPIAVKTNGQQVFSYFNLNEVYTQGLESDLSLNLLQGLDISLGYQFLEAKDQQVIDDLKAGKIFATDLQSGQTRRVSSSDYGGLLNRSPHSGLFKVFYYYQPLRFDVNLRAIYRGDFGFADLNGNSILDTPAEYAPGYTNWHLAMGKSLMKEDMLHIQWGIDNLFGTTREQVPSMPGRFTYLSLSFQLQKSFNKPNP